MEEIESVITVPFVALESERARSERQLKDERDRHDKVKVWMFAIIIILIIALIGCNMAWLAVWNSYDFESYELSTAGGGNANYIGNDGDIYNGESTSPQTD